MIAAELRQELHKADFVSDTIDASNRKEQGHDGSIAPCPFTRRASGTEVAFYKSIIGKSMVYQDRLETDLMQLLAHQETST